MASIIEATREAFAPARRGYHVVYREHEVNHCPGCSRTHWYVGRTMAECAFCSTALPLEASSMIGGAATNFTVTRPVFEQEHAFAA